MRLACQNAFAWSLGNGLATTSLVTYLAAEYGARGLVIGLILASPAIVGLLRQFAPTLIALFQSRKQFCLTAYALSALLLYLLPLLTAPGILPTPSAALAVLVLLWCGYQVAEYFGTVALWSWLGDIAPLPVRGRFLGVRERWLSCGRLIGMLVSGLLAFAWPSLFSRSTLWIPYAACALTGALVMTAALLPLMEMPAFEDGARRRSPLRSWRRNWWQVWRDTRFRSLALYGCWLGAVNGLLQTSQFYYGRNVLGLSLLVVLAMRSQTELGQTCLSPAVGRWIDRTSNTRVMMISQLLVGAAMLCYLLATRPQWWIVWGASTLFIAYAGLNIGIPNLLLRLSPPGEQKNEYIASYYAWAGLAYGVGSLLGGQLFDWAAAWRWSMDVAGWRLDHFTWFFVIGWLLRSAGALWIARIDEPGTKLRAPVA